MKRFLGILIIVLPLFTSAQTRYWVGASGGVWSSASNWSATPAGPAGASSPITNNDVIFDDGFTGVVEMDVLSPAIFTINSLLITANSEVTLRRSQTGGGVRVLQLVSTNALTKGLKIDNGCTLTIDAVNDDMIGTLDYVLALTGAAGVTGEISGNLFIKGTGIGSGGAEIDLQDDATHFASLVVKNTGVIKYFDNTNNTSPSTGSYLTMENGSVYELNKNGGSFPPGTWAPNSLAKVSGTGANPPSFNGNSYGNLEWNCPSQTFVSYFNNSISFNNVNFITTNNAAFRVTTGATAGIYTMTINGDLNISNTTLFMLTSTSVVAPNGGRLHLKGHLNNAGIITTDGATGTVNEFELNGTVNQTINNTGGTITGATTGATQGLSFIMNNAAGATLLSPLTLPSDLTLLNGIITTTSANLLTMVDNAVSSTGSPSTFVNGPMKKIGDEGFTFPIGEGLEYAPIGIGGGTGALSTDAFTAQYFRGNPRVTIGPLYENPPINHMSILEWWTLDRTGNASKEVTLYARTYSDATLLADLRVLRWDGAIWRNGGQVASTGVATGPVRSAITSDFFSPGTPTPFTFGSVTSFENPLPINLISFDAVKINSSKSSINWKLAACCSPLAKFEIQRAGSNRSFTTIGTVNGNPMDIDYAFIDNAIKPGANYYRLKMIDADGTITYSRTVLIMNGVNGVLLTSITPAIITDAATLTTTSSAEEKIDIVIVDIQGRIVQKQKYIVNAGDSHIVLTFNAGLNAGVYQLFAITRGGKTNVLRFIKQ